ncbi:uncharacterized protein METZ01_LOCUS195829, partial [marine metagenome]
MGLGDTQLATELPPIQNSWQPPQSLIIFYY